VAWLGALVGLALLDSGTAAPYVIGGVPLTIAVGALVDRFWVVLVPSMLEVVGLLFYLAADLLSTGCRDCSDWGGWGFVIIVSMMIFTLPATVALAIGLAGRGIARRVSPSSAQA
jgi:hypothetical protein